MHNKATCGVAICEFESFTSDADRIFSPDELEELRCELAYNPESGSKIPGTGGIRKLRFGVEKKGKGKRGGSRVIYYYHSVNMPLALLAVYEKGERIDLTADDKKILKILVGEYVKTHKRR